MKDWGIVSNPTCISGKTKVFLRNEILKIDLFKRLQFVNAYPHP